MNLIMRRLDLQTLSNVTVFLEDFQRIGQKNVLVINRPKNFKGLLDLGITARMRKEVILALTVEDYVKGPSADSSFSIYNIWVFGVFSPLDGQEIYIKLSDRTNNNMAVCLSFHPSEYPLSYPLKRSHGPLNHPLRN